MTEFLKFQNLSIQKNNRYIFKDLNFELPSIGLVYLHGENGAGKTTLLNIIAGIDTSYEGKIYFEGKEITKEKSSEFFERYISYLPQDPLIFDDMSVLDNILISCGKRQMNEALEVLKYFKLDKIKDSLAQDISVGEKQRIAFSRLFINPNHIILLDESYSQLDDENKTLFLNYIKLLKDNHLIIFVSHTKDDIDFDISLTLENKSLKVEKYNVIDNVNLQKQHGNKMQHGLKRLFLRNKMIYLSTLIISILFFSFSIFAGSYFYYLNGDENLDRITQISYNNYINTAPSFILSRENVDYFDNNTVFGLVSSNLANFDGNSVQPGSYLQGIFTPLSFFENSRLNLLYGRYPMNENEYLLSSCHLDYYSNLYNISEEEAFSELQNEPLNQISFDAKVVGIYEGVVNDNYQFRKESRVTTNPLLTISYSFMQEGVFTLSNNYEMIIVENTENNRKNITIDDVSYYIDGEIITPYINLNSEGEGQFKEFFETSRNFFGYMALTLILIVIIQTIIALSYLVKNRRYYMLLRVGGFKRKTLIKQELLIYSIPLLLSLITSSILSVIAISITQSMCISFTREMINTIYISFYYLPLLYVIFSVLFSIVFFFVLLYFAIIPKSLGKQINNLKNRT